MKVKSILLRIAFMCSYGFGFYYFLNFQDIIQYTSEQFSSTIVVLSMVLFMVLLIGGFFLIAKYKNKIRSIIYEIPQDIIEKSYGGKVTSYVLFFIFSLFTTYAIMLLIYLLPPSSFVSILPFENVSATLEQGIQIGTGAIKTIFSQNGIAVNYGPNYNRDVIILFSIIFTGPTLLYLLRELKRHNRKLIQKPEDEKFPGSKSLLIFLYISILIIIPKVLSMPQNDLASTFGWLSSSVSLIILSTSIMTATIYLISNRKA